MPSRATRVDDYLAALPAERREALEAVRRVILANLDAGYEEGMQYGMIGYYVPHRVFPEGYHCDPWQPLPFAGLAAQKNHLALYLMGVYCGPTDAAGETAEARWFRDAWAGTGKRLDMGKSCVRFRRSEDLALEVIGEAIRRMPAATYIERYQHARGARGASRAARGTKAGPAKSSATATKAGGRGTTRATPKRGDARAPAAKRAARARPARQR
jgi:hypothetical protein